MTSEESVDVAVTFDATKLTEERYEVDIIVNSNDPDEPQVLIPTTLVVEETAVRNITATAGPHGTIEPSGEAEVNHGEYVTFTITPDAGYQMKDVLVDGGSVGPVATYTFENVTADHTIHSRFEIAEGEPDITVTPTWLEAAARVGSSATQILTIGNVGTADLHFAMLNSSYEWLSFEPESGTVAPEDAIDIVVTFDATGLAEDTYLAIAFLNSNDSHEAWVPLFITFYVF